MGQKPSHHVTDSSHVHQVTTTANSVDVSIVMDLVILRILARTTCNVNFASAGGTHNTNVQIISLANLNQL